MIPRRFFFASLLLISNALAHDFWIEPTRIVKASSVIEGGERIPLTIKVGSGDDVTLFAWRKSHVAACFLSDGKTRTPISSRDGSSPAATVRAQAPGLYTFAYGSHATKLSLEATKFEAYLKEEGLDAIVAQRKALGESEMVGREAFARCAKTLIRIGDEPATKDALAPVGLDFEIVLDEDPTVPRKPGQAITGRVLLRGAPVAKQLVRSVVLDGTHFTRAVYTDDNGRFGFTFAAGPVMLAAVAMERAHDEPEIDWKSTWATLTFEMSEPMFEMKIEATEAANEPPARSEENR